MIDEAAISYLRRRRATYFFTNGGPALPQGMRARWRLSRGDPHGWQANMVGFIEGRVEGLGHVLDTALHWFTGYRVDTWVDVDEFGVLFGHEELITSRGFRLNDDWEALICRQLLPPAHHSAVHLRFAEGEADLRVAAWIAEQNERHEPIDYEDAAARRRTARYKIEYSDWGTRFAIASLGGQPVGAARLTDEGLPMIVGVATLPMARGRGVATAITALLAAEALAKRGACALYVERNSQASRIYRRLGFVPLYRSRAWVRRYTPAGSQL